MVVSAKNLRSVGRTAFGPVPDTEAGDGNAAGMFTSFRARMLDRRLSYYEARQHSHKGYDFDGRVVDTQSGGEFNATQPLIGREATTYFVPLSQRRPSSPYRLARVIVGAFTSLVFGEGRFPKIRIQGDEDAEDYAQALCEASDLPAKMVRARNLGGSCGTVGLSWCFLDGKPRVNVHNAKNLHVLEWIDREECIPRHVIELYQYPQDDWNPKAKRYDANRYWYRRDWTPNEDVIFEPLLVHAGKPPTPDDWVPDTSRSSMHGDGVTHFVWIQNLECDDVDGLPDYDGLYESFDAIDIVYSVIVRGATLNLDPTLKLKVDPDRVKAMGVKKGSDNALILGESGDADYLELTGTSLTAGIALFESMRKSALEVAQCVVADPDKAATGAVASVTIRIVNAPMLAKANCHRDQYGKGIKRLVDQMMFVARALEASPSEEVTDDEGNIETVERTVNLPPRIETSDVLGEDGKPTGAKQSTPFERTPGQSSDMDLEWPDYYPSSPADQTATLASLAVATGNKAFISVQSANEITAAAYGRDPAAEWDRMQAARSEDEAKQAEMFAMGSTPDGGSLTHEMPVPGGGKVTRQLDPAAPADPANDTGAPAAPAGKPKFTLAPTDLALIVTVDEARKSVGLPPLPEETDGHLPLAAYKAKYAKTVAVAANAETGKTGSPPDADKPTAPPPGAGGAGFGKGAPPGGGPPGADASKGQPGGAVPPPGKSPFPPK